MLIIVTLTNSRGAIVMTVIGFAAIVVHLILIEHPAAYTNVFPRGGSILMFCALPLRQAGLSRSTRCSISA